MQVTKLLTPLGFYNEVSSLSPTLKSPERVLAYFSQLILEARLNPAGLMMPSEGRTTICSSLPQIVLSMHPIWFDVYLALFRSWSCPSLEDKWYVYLTKVCSLCLVFCVVAFTWCGSPPTLGSSSLSHVGSWLAAAADLRALHFPLWWDRTSLPGTSMQVLGFTISLPGLI